MFRRIGLCCLQIAVSGAASFAPGFQPAFEGPSAPTPWPTPCVNHPCAGYVYELIYRVTDGAITKFSAYDPCGPPYFDCSASWPTTSLADDEAWMNIAGHPNVVDIMFHADRYRVDLNTLEIVSRGPPAETQPPAARMAATSTPERNSSEAASPGGNGDNGIPAAILVLTGIAAAGVVSLVAGLWRSTRSR